MNNIAIDPVETPAEAKYVSIIIDAED